MKEIVWVYGPSASGKERLIQFLLSKDGKVLREKLGWNNKKVISCEESVTHIAQFDEDPAYEQRKRIPELVSALTKNYDIILIKGQFVDFEANYPRLLREKHPEALHRIIFLNLDLEELTQRLVQKKWWSGQHDAIAYSKGEIEILGKQLSNLGDEFEITHLDSSKNGSYKFLNIQVPSEDSSTTTR